MAHLHVSPLSRRSPGLMRDRFLEAARRGDYAIVQEYVCYKELFDARDPEGLTALHLAAGQGHAKIVRLLLKHNIPVDIPVIPVDTPAMNRLEEIKRIRRILEITKEKSGQNKEAGRTALHYAVAGGHCKVVAVLLDHQASPHVAN